MFGRDGIGRMDKMGRGNAAPLGEIGGCRSTCYARIAVGSSARPRRPKKATPANASVAARMTITRQSDADGKPVLDGDGSHEIMTIDADSVAYLSLDGLTGAVPNGRSNYCTSCYTGVYPVAFPRDEAAYLQLALKLNPEPAAPSEPDHVAFAALEKDPVVS